MQLAASLDTPLVPELLFERTVSRTWAILPDCFLIFIFHPAILLSLFFEFYYQSMSLRRQMGAS